MTKPGEARIPQPVTVKIYAAPGAPPIVVPPTVEMTPGTKLLLAALT